MNVHGHLVAAMVSIFVGADALAVWGVRYEVNSGGGWTTATTVDVSSGPKSVQFRIFVYHDGATPTQGPYGTTAAWAPIRLCNSQRVTNFSHSTFGDSVVSFAASVSSFNPKAVARAEVGSDTILGTPSSAFSFASDTALGIVNPRPQKLETQFYAGELLVGNSGSGALSRTITLTVNTFAFPGAGLGSGGPYGATFYLASSGGGWGAAAAPSATISAAITVKVPCPADLNDDGVVGDDDFQLFCAAHDLMDCADPSMPAGCPADLTGDGSVDDSDFLIFAAAYDALVCG